MRTRLVFILLLATPLAAEQNSSVAEECIQVHGYSNTLHWLRLQPGGFQDLVNQNEVQYVAIPGSILTRWLQPGFQGWGRAPVSPCDVHSKRPDVIVFQLAEKRLPSSPKAFSTKVVSLIDLILKHYPDVKSIGLFPITGGPDDSVCQIPHPTRGSIEVVASHIHPVMVIGIADGVEQWRAKNPDHPVELVVGPDSEVASCSQFIGAIGHLSPDGQRHVGAEIVAPWFHENGWATDE